jgi:hypothetical protein
MSLSTAVARFVPPMQRTATCIQESLVRSWGGRHERHSNPVRIEAGASEGATCKRSRASPARACHTQTG